jgi:hypothetical protein
MKRILITIALLSGGSAFAQAATPLLTDSGNAFLATCENQTILRSACLSFVGGVLQGYAVSASPALCMPDGITYDQSLRITLKYMQDHPEKLHMVPAALIVVAHLQAFPCPVPQKK